MDKLIREATVDVDEEFASSVIDSMNKRKAEMLDMKAAGSNKTRILFRVPSRGLIGYQSTFLTQTKGTGVLNRIFHSYDLQVHYFSIKFSLELSSSLFQCRCCYIQHF